LPRSVMRTILGNRSVPKSAPSLLEGTRSSFNTLQFLATSVSSAWMSESSTTPVASCPECGQLRAALDEARKLIADLQAELHELRSQLNRNSSNSSSPPSVDPP